MTTNIPATHLGGVAEVADKLGVSRQQVAKLRQREDFPMPVARLSVGDVWDLDVVARWARSGLRRRAGRPGAGDQPRVAVARRFEVLDELGGGGFAVVYRARDLVAQDSGFVALKVLHEVAAADNWSVERFSRELDVMARLSDPHVIPILASGTDERLGLWYAMPLALGSLADSATQPMDVDDVVEVMRDICSGLMYIHQEGILHRDLKPANVLRTQAGNWAIADFGLARTVIESDLRMTSTTEGFGSPFYVAPEQWQDAKHVDERADVFSAGKIMQVLVSARTPSDDLVPPGRLQAVILRAISQDPARRYPTAAALLDAIESAVASVPTGVWEDSHERAMRLRERLSGDGHAPDPAAIAEIASWAQEVDATDEKERRDFCWALSVLQSGALTWWWGQDPGQLERTMDVYTDLLDGSFSFAMCDPLADFARRAVAATQSGRILMLVMVGLPRLGLNHGRWHVRDVAVAILQGIRSEEAAGMALEGLRLAGEDAIEWTIGDTAVRTFHPILRAGLSRLMASRGA